MTSWVTIANRNKSTTSVTINGLNPSTVYTFNLIMLKGKAQLKSSPMAIATPAMPQPQPQPQPGGPGPLFANCPWTIDHPLAYTVDKYGNRTWYNYGVVNGSLYGPSGAPVYTDVQQGATGDCWLLSTFAESAYRNPSFITRMFTNLGTYNEIGNTVHCWSVTFRSMGLYPTKSFIVDNEFPIYANGNTVFAHPINSALWVALAEKAYIQAAAVGYTSITKTNPHDDSYWSINGNDPILNTPLDAVEALTGSGGVSEPLPISQSELDAYFSVNDLIILVTGDTVTDKNLVPDHAYALLSQFSGNSQNPYIVFNPWNQGTWTTYTDLGGNSYNVYGSTLYCNNGEIFQKFMRICGG